MTERYIPDELAGAEPEYEPPTLSVVGSVEDLTRGVTGSVADGMSFTPGRHETPGPP